MPTPEFVLSLREKIGHELLWLTGVTAVILRPRMGATGTTADATGAAAGTGAAAEEVLLVRRSDNGAWTPVTGIIDPGEGVRATAEREALEETGVVIEVERLVQVQVLPPQQYPNGDRSQYLDHVVRARWVSGEAHVADEESTEVGWFALDALPPLSESHASRIRHAVANAPEAILD